MMVSEKDQLDAGILCRGLKIDGVENMAVVLASIRATMASPSASGRLRDVSWPLERALDQLRRIENKKVLRRATKNRAASEEFDSDEPF